LKFIITLGSLFLWVGMPCMFIVQQQLYLYLWPQLLCVKLHVLSFHHDKTNVVCRFILRFYHVFSHLRSQKSPVWYM